MQGVTGQDQVEPLKLLQGHFLPASWVHLLKEKFVSPAFGRQEVPHALGGFQGRYLTAQGLQRQGKNPGTRSHVQHSPAGAHLTLQKLKDWRVVVIVFQPELLPAGLGVPIGRSFLVSRRIPGHGRKKAMKDPFGG